MRSRLHGKGRDFLVMEIQGILNRLENELYIFLLKRIQFSVLKKHLKNTGKIKNTGTVREFCQSVKVGTMFCGIHRIYLFVNLITQN